MERAGITIRRFASVYRCAPKSDAGARLRDRLDTVARSSIATQVEAMATALARADDRSVWVIRRLAFHCVINAGWNDDRIARAWARRLVYALALELAAGGTDGVIRFDSPAAQLAHFLADVADGDAFGKWYNAGFSGLKALPASSALRTALVEGGGDGVDALRTLPEPRLQAMLQTLSPVDALAVLRAFAGIADTVAPVDLVEVAGRMARRRPAYPVTDPRWGLAVFAWANRELPGLARTLVELAAAAALQALRLEPGQPAQAPAKGAWPELLGAARILERLPEPVRKLLPDIPATVAPPGHTAFGGGFLLLPVLLDMPFEDWTRGWPELGGMPAARVLRILVLGTCLGPGLLADPVWRELLGIPGHAGWRTIAAELTQLRPRMVGWLRAGLAAHAREHGGVPLRRRTVCAARERWRVEHDAAGYWHRIAAEGGHAPRGVADADLDYLLERLPVPLPPGWRRLLCLAAQQAMRRFARRLPGFALSHLAYLHANFLCLPASVEWRGERLVAGLGRPLLALMLNLAGMTRTEYALPWLPGRSCVLHVEDP